MSQSAKLEPVREQKTDMDHVSQREKETIAESGARSALLSFDGTTSTVPLTKHDATDASASVASQDSRCLHSSDVPLHPWPRKGPTKVVSKRAMATHRIRQILETRTGMNSTFSLLPAQVADLVFLAPTNDDSDWPSNEAELHDLRKVFQGQDLDVPSRFIDQAHDKDLWFEILHAAYEDSPSLLPIQHSLRPSICVGNADGLPERRDECALFFKSHDDTEIMVLVGLRQWKWLNLENKCMGHYFRMNALVLRRNGCRYQPETPSDDDRSHEEWSTASGSDYEEDEIDMKRIDDDFQPVLIDEVTSIVTVGCGRHAYPSFAQDPEALWTWADNRDPKCWHMISGVSRPGYFIKNYPCITMRPSFHDGNQWRFQSVRPLGECVRAGKFLLRIESPGLNKLAREVITVGCASFADKNEIEMRRFLRGLSDAFDEVLCEAGINVVHINWPHKLAWAACEEVEEVDGRLPITFQLPGSSAESGPELKVRLQVEGNNLLCAHTDFSYIGAEGRGPMNPSSQTFRVCVHSQLLGREGLHKVQTAIKLVTNCNAPRARLVLKPPTEWLEPRQNRSPWLDTFVCDYLMSPRSFAESVLLLAAGTCPDAPISTSRITRFKTRVPGPGQREQLIDLVLECEDRQVWLKVHVQRMFTNYYNYSLHEPCQIEVTVTVTPGEAQHRPCCTLSNSAYSAADQVLAMYFHANLFVVDEKEPGGEYCCLLQALGQGGEAFLTCDHHLFRWLGEDKKAALEHMLQDMVEFLCLLQKGGIVKTISLKHNVEYIGQGTNVRAVPTRVVWKGIIEAPVPACKDAAKKIKIVLWPEGGSVELLFRASPDMVHGPRFKKEMPAFHSDGEDSGVEVLDSGVEEVDAGPPKTADVLCSTPSEQERVDPTYLAQEDVACVASTAMVPPENSGDSSCLQPDHDASVCLAQQDISPLAGASKSDHSDDASEAGSCISMMSASTVPAFERSLKRSPSMTSYLDTSDIPESAKPVLVKLFDAAEMAYQQAATLRAYAEELRNALSQDRVALGQKRHKASSD